MEAILKSLFFLFAFFLAFLVHNVVCTCTQCLLYICTHFYGRLNSSGLMTLEFLPEDHISHLVFLITTQMSLFKQQKLFVTTRLRLYELHIWPNYVVDIFSRVLLLSNVGYVHSFAFGYCTQLPSYFNFCGQNNLQKLMLFPFLKLPASVRN